MSTRITWTALPDGVDEDGALRLSVHVGPRLTPTPGPTGTLGGSVFERWPEIVDALGFVVEIDGAPWPATVVNTPSLHLSAWQRLFPSTTTVEPFVFTDLTGSQILSYPAAAVQDLVGLLYGTVGATAPTTPPPVASLAPILEPVRFTGRDGAPRREQLRSQLAGLLAEKGFVPPPQPGDDPGLAFVQATDFHAPLQGAAVGAVPIPTLEFHDVVALCQQYPSLLRALGLVVDLRIETAAVDQVLPTGAVDVRVLPQWPEELTGPDLPVEDVHVVSRTTMSGFRLRSNPTPQPNDLSLVDGHLPVEDQTRYRILHVDTDGAAEKVVDFAGALYVAQQNASVDTPESEPLPALRTGGIALARVGMAGQLKSTIDANAALDGAATPTVWAEDVTRGYRVDVWDAERRRWYPLTAWTGTYAIGSGPAAVEVDETREGFVSVVPTAAFDGANGTLKQPETLFHWTGWSLVAPRPAGALSDPDPSGPPDPVDADNPAIVRPGDTTPAGFDLVATLTAAPGSLPRLRYGHGYRLRVRAVDLAGNSVPFGDPGTSDFTHATPELRYGRFEPVQTPPVLLAAPSTEGESVERIVIRGDHDVATVATSDRHVVPPKASSQLVEEDARLDTGPNGALDPASYTLLAGRDGKRLDGTSAADLGPVAPGQSQAGTPDPRLPGTYYFTRNELRVPYLPDPKAAGAALTFLDGPLAGQSFRFPFPPGPTWPDLRAFRLRLRAGTGAPSETSLLDGSRLVQVPVGKGEVVRVALSAHLAGDPDLDDLAIWGWITLVAPLLGVDPNDLRAGAKEGRHWMLTPPRVLTLVHAVKHPLAVPAFSSGFSTARLLGDTFARLRDPAFVLDRKSTAEVAIVGSWQEPVDRGPGTGAPDTSTPFSLRTTDVAFTHKVEDPPGPDTDLVSGQHEFHDTKHRVVAYHAVAKTRFSEYFVERQSGLTVPATGTALTIDGTNGVAGGTVVVTPAGGGDPYPEGDGFTVDPVAGTVTFGDSTTGPAPAPGDAVDVAYVPGTITRTSARVTKSIPSSARPAAPRALYVLPAFEWRLEGDSSTTQSTRIGNWLRLYLERPWWSSGEGELLGVVVWPGADLPPGTVDLVVPAELAPYVTRWGSDPVYGSAALPSRHPGLSRFPAARRTGTDLTLAEVAGHRVAVAGHRVDYDPGRDLWYCDLSVASGSAYTPFVRFALARFQPNSLTDAHLSPIVSSDVAQLQPGRVATVVWDAQAPEAVASVTVAGLSYDATEAGPGPGVCRISVERRRPQLGGPQLGWQREGQPLELTAQALGDGHWAWQGAIELGESRFTTAYRLVVEQSERHRTDGAVGTQPRVVRVGERIVHQDVIALSPATVIDPGADA